MAPKTGAKKLKVEYAKTAELVPYANNAKIHTEEQVKHIVHSIKEFGFNDPVGVWTNPDGQIEIVEGHGRVLALEMMGVDEVPIVRLDHMTDEQRRAYAHVHNQTTLESGFDFDKLERDIQQLPDFDWDGFGFEFSDSDSSEEECGDDIDDNTVIVVEPPEDEIEEIYQKLMDEGYPCRLLTL